MLKLAAITEPTQQEIRTRALPATDQHTLRHTGGTVSQVDTSPKARDAYFRRLAEMTPSERLAVGAALWRAGDSLQRSAMRRMHPLADDAEINFRIAVTRFGLELARKVYRRQ